MTKHTSNYYSLVTFAMHTQAFCHPLLLSRRPVDSNDNGDVSEDSKNAIGLISKTKTLHVHHAFLYISLPSLRDYDRVKMPIFTSSGGR